MPHLVNQIVTSDNQATGLPSVNATLPTTLDTLPKDGFIRVMPLARLLGIHHQTLRRWWKSDNFPRPQRRNGILLFKNSDVKNWIDNQPQVIA